MDDIASASKTPNMVDAFCREIHYSDRRYLEIDSLFVMPKDYAKILEIAEKYHVICITGDPFMGKSYTALHLLYQFFTQGFVVQKPETRELRDVVIQLLHSLDSSLAGKRAIYIEDPFGQEHFTRFHELASEFPKLVEAAARSDSRVILTSRSELFKQGLGPLADSNLVAAIRVELKLGSDESRESAYSRDDLSQIFERYVQLYKPVWARDAQLKGSVTSEALRELYAPPSLEFFVSNYRREPTYRALVRGINNSRKENVAPAFGQEIAQGPIQEIAFWLLFDVLREDLGAIEQIFKFRVQPALGIESATMWDEYLEKHRLKFTAYHYAGTTFFKFYHPFLVEAISYAINEFPRADSALSLVYDVLTEERNPFIFVDMAESILRRINTSSHAQLRLLDRLVGHKDYLVRAGVAASLVKYLVEVTGEARQRLETWLVQLANDKETWVRRNIAVAIAQNYENISRVSPQAVTIFHGLSENPDPNVRYAVAEAVLWYYRDVPHLHMYLWKQADDKAELARGLLADALIWQFQVLSKSDQLKALDIIQKYASSDTDKVRGWVKTALAWHWDSLQELPQEALDGIWQSLGAENPVIYQAAADLLEWHHQYFEKYKPQFIGTLTSKAVRPTEFTGIMQTLFWGGEPHPLPSEVQAYFERLANSADPRVRGWSAFAFSVRYSQFPPESRNTLNKLASDPSPETRLIVAQCIAANYSRAPEAMHGLLARLAADTEPRVQLGVIEAVDSLGSEVPLNERQHFRNLSS